MPLRKRRAIDEVFVAIVVTFRSTFKMIAFYFCPTHRAVVAGNHDCEGKLFYLFCNGHCKILNGWACALHDGRHKDDIAARAIDFIEQGVWV